ncbi:hypothetical protein Hanom_Chr12g01166481 [Helianthus anomalus]
MQCRLQVYSVSFSASIGFMSSSSPSLLLTTVSVTLPCFCCSSCFSLWISRSLFSSFSSRISVCNKARTC